MEKLILAFGVTLLMVACGSKGGSDNSGTPATGTAATTGLSGIDNSCVASGTVGPIGSANNGTAVCNNSVYNQYNGWAAYPNANLQNYYQNGVYRFCGCPAGMVPAYGATAGMGCVQYNLVPSNAYQWSLGTGYNWAFAQSTFNQSAYYNNYSNNYYGNYNRSYDPRPNGNSYYQNGFGQGGYYRGGSFYPVGGSFDNDGTQYAPTLNNSTNFQQISGMNNSYNSSNCSSSTAVQSCFVDIANSCGNGTACVPTNGTRIGICTNSVSSGSGTR